MWHVICKRPNVTFNTTSNLKPSQAFLTFKKSLLNVQSCSNHMITHFHKHHDKYMYCVISLETSECSLKAMVCVKLNHNAKVQSCNI